MGDSCIEEVSGGGSGAGLGLRFVQPSLFRYGWGKGGGEMEGRGLFFLAGGGGWLFDDCCSDVMMLLVDIFHSLLIALA